MEHLATERECAQFSLLPGCRYARQH